METKPKTFDLIVIGSGPGGYLSAILACQKGLSVAVIEKSELGGTCLNRGCIPTKALIKEAFLWDAFSKSGWVEEKGSGPLAYRKATEKKDAAVNQVVSGLRGLLNRERITIFQGKGTFLNSRTVLIKREGEIIERLESERILIASGAVPKEIPGLRRDGQWVMGSDDILRMTDLPARMAIVGGGRRGVEFATLFNTYGVKVTLIEKENRILPKMDREISVRYKTILTKRNIKVLTETEAVTRDSFERNGLLNLGVLRKGKEERIESEKILLVGDRSGNTDELDLSKASLSLKEGFIPVDLHMKTSSPGIYAAGDITGKACLAHRAFHEAKIAVENMSGKTIEANYRLIPLCLYAYPEASSIGLTEEEAREKWGEIKVGKFPFMGCGRGVAAQEQEGIVKIISEPKYGEILGVHILGSVATEMIHLAGMAMKNEICVEEIGEVNFAHPTFSEAFLEAALDTYGEAIHMLKG